uniref:Uncharacterized protein n=1 Tax=Callithrix jacchus TaxID=9483 RepID=A0A5F4W095_CALJA
MPLARQRPQNASCGRRVSETQRRQGPCDQVAAARPEASGRRSDFRSLARRPEGAGPPFSARAPGPCRPGFASWSEKEAVPRPPILFGEKQASLTLWSRKFRLGKGRIFFPFL